METKYLVTECDLLATQYDKTVVEKATTTVLIIFVLNNLHFYKDKGKNPNFSINTRSVARLLPGNQLHFLITDKLCQVKECKIISEASLLTGWLAVLSTSFPIS